MQCETCGTTNPPQNRFCGQCGAALVRACAACGHANPPGSRFCGACGTALPDPAAAGPLPRRTAAWAAGEAMDYDAALAYALEEESDTGAAPEA